VRAFANPGASEVGAVFGCGLGPFEPRANGTRIASPRFPVVPWTLMVVGPAVFESCAGKVLCNGTDQVMARGVRLTLPGKESAVLVLSRKSGESIVLPLSQTTITVVKVTRERVKLGIVAPADVSVQRGELLMSTAATTEKAPKTCVHGEQTLPRKTPGKRPSPPRRANHSRRPK
jgi:carbon storage regulator CsrA